MTRITAIIAALVAALSFAFTTQTAPPPSPGTSFAATSPVAVFVGDSYTEAIGNEHDRWSTQSAAALGWTEINNGNGGTGYVSSITLGGIFYPNYHGRIGLIASYNPAIVVVSGGRNDLWVSTSTIAAAMVTFLTDLRAAVPNARIITVAPIGHHDPIPVLQDLYVPLALATHAIAGCPINLNDPLVGHPEWVYPGDIHPNSAGHTAIANAFISAVNELPAGSCITQPTLTRTTRPFPTIVPTPGPRR